MSNLIMYRDDAEKYCTENGWKLFLDRLIKEKIIVLERKVTTVFETSDYKNAEYGTIRLEEWPEGLVLWVAGHSVWRSWIR